MKEKWIEENEIIHFFATSEKINGINWIEKLKNEGIYIGENAQKIIENFIPTTEKTSYCNY